MGITARGSCSVRAIFKSSPDGDHSSLWEEARPESLISRVAVTKNFRFFVPTHPKKRLLLYGRGAKMENSVLYHKADVATEHKSERGNSTRAERIPIKMLISPSLSSARAL